MAPALTVLAVGQRLERRADFVMATTKIAKATRERILGNNRN
jgi:hypothetical protein